MLRHVFCCLAPEASGDGPRIAAVRFAAGYGATLTGLFVRKPPPAPFPPMADPMIPTFPSPAMLKAYEDEVRAHEAAQDELARAAAARFEEDCRAARLASRTLIRTGEPGSEIVSGARTADLVVAGRGQHEDSTLGSVSGWLVRHLARPVMLVGRPFDALSRIAVAYDGSLGAERALALSADIAASWKGPALEVHLIHARRPDEPHSADLAAAEHYLDVYGVRARTHDVVGRPADAIVEMAERADADLLIMGAYGHSLIREVMLGSTTQEIIARWRHPLLVWR